MGMMDWFSNPLKMPEGGLNSLAGNPLMLAGLQILSNSQRGGPRRSLFQGVGQSLTSASQNNMLMQEAARREADQKYQEQERQRAETERNAGNAALSQVGNILDARNKYVQGAHNLEGLGGGPMQPPPSGNIQSILFNSGNPQLQAAALAQAMQPPKAPISASAGETLLDPTTYKPIFQAPPDPSKLSFEQRMQLAQARGAAQGGAGQEYMSFIDTPDGVFGGYNKGPRIGQVVPLMANGKPLVKAASSPELQGQIAGARKGAEGNAEIMVDKPKAISATKAAITNINKIQGTVAQLLNNKRGLERSTGVMGALPTMPGSDSANWQADRDTLRSQLSIRGLQEMRDASKTGGAIGSATEREWDMLANAYSNLIQSQSAPEFRANLEALNRQLEGSKQAINQAFATQYSGNNPAPAGSGSYDYVPGQGLVHR